MKNILIVGKNSFYYKQLKDDLKNIFNVVEISHLDLSVNSDSNNIQWDLILIFARVKSYSFFNSLQHNYKSKKIVLISSVILDLPTNFKYYSYYIEKYNVEKWYNSINNSNLIIIRSGTIESESALIYSKKIDFISVISNLDKLSKIISLPLYKKEYKIPHLFYRFIFNFYYGYIFMRPLDIMYKYLNGYVYGYIYAIEKILNINKR